MKIDQKVIDDIIKYLPRYIKDVIAKVIREKKISFHSVRKRTLKKYLTEEDDINEINATAAVLTNFNYKVLVNRDKNLSEKDFIIAILHEMVHIWQYETNWDWVVDCDFQYRNLPYNENPVEIEAINKSILFYHRRKRLF